MKFTINCYSLQMFLICRQNIFNGLAIIGYRLKKVYEGYYYANEFIGNCKT